SQGKSRFEFSREDLYKQVWDFVSANRGNMELQLRALGASADWENGVFTLDKKVIETTYDTFKRMWDDGLIYRGERIVNFCPTHQTAFADIEVVHKEIPGKLYEINYPMLDKVANITVATTRPETMLGDTAIAVHPDDTRYKEFIGMTVMVPIVKREIPIIADEAVDPSFGTGAVKVTPAHDPTDYEIGKRHSLPMINVIGTDGKMSRAAGSFEGLTPLEARDRIIQELETEDEFYKGSKDYTHAVGHCYKCGSIIEPLLKEQWFLKVEPLAKKAIEAIESGEVTFTPKNKGKVLVDYLKNLHDWNLSRQIAWGIPIPAFVNIEDNQDWIFDVRVDQPTIEVGGKTYQREEDTFD
ncbi:valine--tRNA ligase, partial [Candidatus Saccharibacteria bacterium 32-49-10]